MHAPMRFFQRIFLFSGLVQQPATLDFTIKVQSYNKETYTQIPLVLERIDSIDVKWDKISWKICVEFRLMEII